MNIENEKIKNEKCFPNLITKIKKMTTQEKITTLFEKLPIEEQIKVFDILKEFLNGKLIEQASFHEEQQSKLLAIKDSINNGK